MYKLKKNCIVFGTGTFAERILNKVKYEYNIIAFADNEVKKQGTEFHSIAVISPLKIKEYNETVIICSVFYLEIINQLRDMGIEDILYYEPQTKLQISPFRMETKITTNRELSRILYIQNCPCIRTYKVSCLMKEQGISVDLAYWEKDPEQRYGEMGMPWDNIIPINDLEDFFTYVEHENYDLIHFSNEPDGFMHLLLRTNKKVVYDNHDMYSWLVNVKFDDIVGEFVANKYAHGRMYVLEGVLQYAKQRYHIPDKNNLILGNYMLQSLKPKEYIPKISSADGELHCVYEGGIEEEYGQLRYYEEMFLQLAACNIHVHFYTMQEKKYYTKLDSMSEYLHYEGYKNIKDLLYDMTKYDVGLAIFNITEKNKEFLHSSSPNKVFDYLFSELPIAISDIPSHIDFVKKYCVGNRLEWDNTLSEQLQRIKEIKIDKNFLYQNALTMDNYVEEIMEFYKDVKYGN